MTAVPGTGAVIAETDARLRKGWAVSGVSRTAAGGMWTATASLACPDDGEFGCAGFIEVSACGTLDGALAALPAAVTTRGAAAIREHRERLVDRLEAAGLDAGATARLRAGRGLPADDAARRGRH